MRIYNRAKARPASDFQTVKLSERLLHHLMSIGNGFLGGSGNSHVKRCTCDGCKYVRRSYRRVGLVRYT
jgi:hypothetical protein